MKLVLEALPLTHAHLRGCHVQHLEGSIGSYVSSQARVMRNAPALCWPGGSLTYWELASRVRTLGNSFLEFGAKMQRRILIVQPHGPHTLIPTLAAATVGAVPVLVPHVGLTPQRFRTFLTQFSPGVLLMAASIDVGAAAPVDAASLVTSVWPEFAATPEGAPLKRRQRHTHVKKILISAPTGSPEVAASPLLSRAHRAHIHGPTSLYEGAASRNAHYTSPRWLPAFASPVGEAPHSRRAGNPEMWVAPVATHSHAVNAARAIQLLAELTRDDRVAVLPGHRHSLPIALAAPLAAILAGGVISYPAASRLPSAGGPAAVAAAVAADAPTVVVGTLSALRDAAAAAAPGRGGGGRVRTAVAFVPPSYTEWACGGALAALGGDAEAVQRWLGCDRVIVVGGPWQAFGMLEACAFPAATPALLPTCEVRVCTPTAGVVRPRGEAGPVFARGAAVSALYWNNVGLCEAALDGGGFLRTGRVGAVDAAGRVCVGDEADDDYLPPAY